MPAVLGGRPRAERQIGPESVWEADISLPMLETTVAERLRSLGRDEPEQPALIWADGQADQVMSYRELLYRAESGARRLLALASPGDRIAVWGANTVEVAVLVHSASLAGMVLVILNPNFTEPEVEYILADSAAVALFAAEDVRGKPLLTRARQLAAGAGTVAHVGALGEWSDPGTAWPVPGRPLPAISPDDPILIQYTSGTTGRPKGAAMSHRLWVNSPRFGVIGSDQSPHRVYCTAFPFCHVSGFGALMQVMTGASALVLIAMFEPTEMLAMCEAHRATAIGLVPTMAIRLMDDPTFAQRDLSSLRAIYCGGTHTQPELVRRIEAAFGAPVYVAYGQSESPWITMTSAEDTDAEKAESVGRPTWHRAVKIADPMTSVPVPIGDVGELCTRSPMVMSGYVGAAADESAVDAEGWLRTGDLCSMNERGVISFRGRTREVIIRGGENVYPIEVERVIVQQAAVAEVAVAGWPDPEWGEIVVAFVRLEGGATADVEALERFCRSELASFKVPRQWVFLDAFPTTAAGKIKKGELKLDNEKESPDE